MSLFNIAVRMEARQAARELGYDFFEIRRFVANLSDEIIAKARGELKIQLPEHLVGADEKRVFVAFGDGAILKAIFDFLKSPEGQAFIKFLIGLFMGL